MSRETALLRKIADYKDRFGGFPQDVTYEQLGEALQSILVADDMRKNEDVFERVVEGYRKAQHEHTDRVMRNYARS